MRDLFVFGFVILTLPKSYRQPFFGLLVFSWLAYMRPQDLCWGFAREMRLSFFVGIAMIAGWWANEKGRRAYAVWDVRSVLMVLLTTFITFSYLLAKKNSEYTTRYFVEYLKIIAVALFVTGQTDTKARLRTMFWTIALSLGFFGVKGGLFGVLRGGTQITRGPGGMLEDNNDFALALVMNVPLLWYMGLSERKLPNARRLTQIAVGLTVVTVLLTHSRGAFLALSATALWIAWRSGKLVRATLVLGTLAALFPLLAPQHVLERLSTIGDTHESSANARLTAWGTALRMIQDNPLFGVGIRNFQTRFLDYAPYGPGEGQTYVSHNSYLQIWAESGSIAFAIYMVMIASVFFTCRKVYRIGRVRADLAWAADYARMMEATTIGFMVGAFFLNRGHFDLVYHWFAMVTALGAVAYTAYMRSPSAEAAPGARTGKVTIGKRPRGAVRAASPAPAAVVWRRAGRWR
ncbi:MAG TPA: putative O-glycosylation ligase, exosortase A system-associated [Planctomycetota bacterium]|nr:putative O-glycosylation ligase, exosortase A system-associated [Planctomycetota bacterium]